MSFNSYEYRRMTIELCKVSFVVPVLLCLMMLGCTPPTAAAAAFHTSIARISNLGSSFAGCRQLCFDKLTPVLQVELPKQRVCSCFLELDPPSLHNSILLFSGNIEAPT